MRAFDDDDDDDRLVAIKIETGTCLEFRCKKKDQHPHCGKKLFDQKTSRNFFSVSLQLNEPLLAALLNEKKV